MWQLVGLGERRRLNPPEHFEKSIARAMRTRTGTGMVEVVDDL